MKKHFIIVVLVVCLALPIFAAGQPETAAQEITTITFWHSFSEGDRQQKLAEMVASYEAENPNIRINMEVFPWGEFNTKWRAAIATNSLPDLSSVQLHQIPMMARAEILQPVGGVIDRIGRQNLYEAPLEYMTIDGDVVALPLYLHARVLWYRKDILAQHGLQPPRTWDEYLSHARIVHNPPDVYGQVVPFSRTDGTATMWLYMRARSMGDHLLTRDGKVNLTSPNMIRAIQYWVDMYHAVSPGGSINYGTTETSNLWYQGRTAFDINSGFHIAGVLRNAPDLDGKIGAFRPPRETVDSPHGSAFSGMFGMVMYNTTRNPEAVADFLAYIYGLERYTDFLLSIPGGMLPARSDVATSSQFNAHPVVQSYREDIQVILDAIAESPPQYFDYGPSIEATVLGSHNFVSEMFQRIIAENVPIRQAAREAEEKFNAVIADLQ